MSTKNEATPRPWRANGISIECDDGDNGRTRVILSADCHQDDAERIVKRAVEAVNQYDHVRELVEAARDTYDVIRTLRRSPYLSTRDCYRVGEMPAQTVDAAEERLRAALAKAAGRE